MVIANIDDAFNYLLSFTNLEKGPSLMTLRNMRLDHMHALLEQFGNPHLEYRTLHIAGTKGKGSTASFLASVLTRAGFRTGLYTSPHVSHFLERISITSQDPNEELLVELTNWIRQAVESNPEAHDWPLTTFELLTLLAFLYFRESRCELAVIETGLGGRLDATNVVSPDLCLITPIELEHTDVLGESLENIAREKGGIIKPTVPVFSGYQEPEVKEMLRNICREKGSEILFLDEAAESLEASCSPTGTELRLRLKGEPPKRFSLSLLGDFQAENAALAYLALIRSFDLAEDCFTEGFRETFLPGRMEVISRHPYVVLDGAHTPRSIQRLHNAFHDLFDENGVLLFGAVAGKKTKEMAEILAPSFRRIIITTPGFFKESDPEEVYQIFHRKNKNTRLIRSPEQAARKALDLSGGEAPLLITGSFYLLGEVRKLWLSRKPLHQSSL